MSSPLPILSGEIGDLISALNRLSLALENHLAACTASGSHPASSVPDSAQLVDSPWILVEEEEELPRGYKDEREYTPADPIRIQDTHYLVLCCGLGITTLVSSSCLAVFAPSQTWL